MKKIASPKEQERVCNAMENAGFMVWYHNETEILVSLGKRSLSAREVRIALSQAGLPEYVLGQQIVSGNREIIIRSI